MASYKSNYNRSADSFTPDYAHYATPDAVKGWERADLTRPYGTDWSDTIRWSVEMYVKEDAQECVIEVWGREEHETAFKLLYGPCHACGEDVESHCTCSDDRRAGRTRVIFRKYEGEVIAVMPEMDSGAWDSVLVYSRSWVAGMSPRRIMTDTRRAAPSEIEASGLMQILENDLGTMRRITYAQLLADDCNGGIGPSDPAHDLYDVGCGWMERAGFCGMHSNAQDELKREMIEVYGK